MLLNPAGGLNGGDRARTSIHLAPGAHACLATPSAARVYRALDAPSLQHTSIRLEASAHLDFLPDHLIPHSGADLLQSLHLDLHPSASAVLWDAFAAGRVASGELWQFRRLDSRLQVFSAGEPLFVSRSLLRPALQSPAAFAVMEQFPYTATLLALGPFDAAPAALALSALLASIPGLRASASPLRRHGLSLRILAASTVALAAARTLAWNWIRESLLGLPVIDLRKY